MNAELGQARARCHPRLTHMREDVDARDKRGHDGGGERVRAARAGGPGTASWPRALRLLTRRSKGAPPAGPSLGIEDTSVPPIGVDTENVSVHNPTQRVSFRFPAGGVGMRAETSISRSTSASIRSVVADASNGELNHIARGWNRSPGQPQPLCSSDSSGGSSVDIASLCQKYLPLTAPDARRCHVEMRAL